MEKTFAKDVNPLSSEVISLPSSFLERTRTLGLDDQQNQIVELSAKDGEPLRDQFTAARQAKK